VYNQTVASGRRGDATKAEEEVEQVVVTVVCAEATRSSAALLS
jgi:hypothetical protein